MPAPVYRPNVGIILTNAIGRILIGERIGMPDAWQFPQGGLDPGETPETGLSREVSEELSLEPTDYFIEERRGPYRYLFPPGVTKKGFSGQEQTYFRMRLTAPESKIDVCTKDAEFSSVRWIEPVEFSLSWLPEMKREVYRQVFCDFFALKIV